MNTVPLRMNAFQRLGQHPTGFWFVFWGELAERASFYGMRTVLALYLTSILRFRQEDGAAIMTAFMASCYITPLLGGFLADRVLGRYRTILYFSGPYVMGHIILGGWESRPGLFIALGLLALGSGSIKPNTSTLMGQIYEEQKKQSLLTEAFSYFYAAINIGSAISTLALPKLRDTIANVQPTAGLTGAHLAEVTASNLRGLEHGYAVALSIPAALMIVAFGAFAAGKKHYPVEKVRDLPPKSAAQKSAERETLGRISGLFALIAVFWFVYDQSASTWIYFAQDRTDLRLFGNVHTTADQIQGLNPILIVMFTPLFNALWEMLKNRNLRKLHAVANDPAYRPTPKDIARAEVPDTRKMFLGFIIVIACMATMAVAGYISSPTHKISVWWIMVATIVITLSELCISVVGLEFAFKVAAPGTKSAVTAAFLFTVFVGDFVATPFDKLLWGKISPGNFFALQAVIMTVTGILFVGIARKFERQERERAEALPQSDVAA